MRPTRCTQLILLVIGALLVSPGLPAEDCPELLNTVPEVGTTAVAAWGSHAYFGRFSVSGQAVLLVADVSDPALAQIVGELALSDPITGIAVSGNYAYLAAGGLRVVDVSNPASPVEVGFHGTPDCASGVALSRNYAFVAS